MVNVGRKSILVNRKYQSSKSFRVLAEGKNNRKPSYLERTVQKTSWQSFKSYLTNTNYNPELLVISYYLKTVRTLFGKFARRLICVFQGNIEIELKRRLIKWHFVQTRQTLQNFPNCLERISFLKILTIAKVTFTR